MQRKEILYISVEMQPSALDQCIKHNDALIGQMILLPLIGEMTLENHRLVK